jgi:lipopolysaccharide transport system permease protein
VSNPIALTALPHAEPAPDEPPVTVIRPARGWPTLDLRELWSYRELVLFLAWRDLTVRYKRTVLGVAWAVLQPILMMVVFSAFFGRTARPTSDGVPYSLFVLAGLLPWTLFASAVSAAGQSVAGSERLIAKVYFPRIALPLAALAATLVDFLAGSAVLAALMLYHGVAPGPSLLMVPGLVALVALAALGVGSLLAALNVAYRDVKYVIPFLMQLWLFATPTIYLRDTPPATDLIGRLLRLNPMTGLVGAFRAAVLGEGARWEMLGPPALGVAALVVVGVLYFRRVEDSFADVI